MLTWSCKVLCAASCVVVLFMVVVVWWRCACVCHAMMLGGKRLGVDVLCLRGGGCALVPLRLCDAQAVWWGERAVV